MEIIRTALVIIGIATISAITIGTIAVIVVRILAKIMLK